MNSPDFSMPRRSFLAASGALVAEAVRRTAFGGQDAPARPKAQIAITLDLEMSRHYPKRGITEWDYQKGNLDEATKQYAVEAGKLVRARGGVIHFFCVGRVLEQANVDWLRQLAADGHPIGNHTYDHVNLLAEEPTKTQFRFERAPWLVAGKTAREVIYENIRLTNVALSRRAGITANGFRTPGGFHQGLSERPDLQQMLLDLGFTWVSSKYPPHPSGKPMEEPPADVYEAIIAAQAQAQPTPYPTGLIEIPMSPISDVTAFRSHFWKREYFLKAVGAAVKWAIRERAVFDFLAHPSCLVVEDPKLETIQMICDLVESAKDRAEIVGLDQIAATVRA